MATKYNKGLDVMYLRRLAGLTQKQLAKLVGCSRFYLCTIERGHARGSEELMTRIMNLLKDRTKP